MVFVNSIFSNIFYAGAVQIAAKIKNAVVIQSQQAVLDCANELIQQLNNAVDNLCAGASKWNRSIGQAFDPTAWAYIDNRSGVPQIWGDNTTLRYTSPQSVPGGIYPSIPMVRGFFLTDERDGFRIQSMVYLASNYGIEPVAIWKGRKAKTNQVFLYSSSNNFFIPHDEGATCDIYYIYKDPITKRRSWRLL